MQETVIVMIVMRGWRIHGGAGFEWLDFGEIRVSPMFDVWNHEIFIPIDIL
jgi:hypothetical protein